MWKTTFQATHRNDCHILKWLNLCRYGIRPEWLQIHHVISKQTMKDGTNQFFIKWRDLPYVDCSWEDEEMNIPDFPVRLCSTHGYVVHFWSSNTFTNHIAQQFESCMWSSLSNDCVRCSCRSLSSIMKTCATSAAPMATGWRRRRKRRARKKETTESVGTIRRRRNRRETSTLSTKASRTGCPKASLSILTRWATTLAPGAHTRGKNLKGAPLD